MEDVLWKRGKEMMTTELSPLEKIALKCQDKESSLAKTGSDGYRYCIMDAENISDGNKCKYQGNLRVTDDNHIKVECNYRVRR